MPKRVKLPKRIAGIKVPKSVRKGPIMDFVNTPAGQILLAQALAVAAGAYAVKHTDPDSQAGELVRHPVDNLKKAGKRARVANAEAMQRMTRAVGAALEAFKTSLAEDRTEADMIARPADLGDGDEGEAPKKKPSRRESAATPH